MFHPNRYKFLKPPTIEQIDAVVAKAGVSDAQFERYHNMHAGAIKFVRMGIRTMPAKHWHLFLEPKPDYGTNAGNKTIKYTKTIPKQRASIKADSRLSNLLSGTT